MLRRTLFTTLFLILEPGCGNSKRWTSAALFRRQPTKVSNLLMESELITKSLPTIAKADRSCQKQPSESSRRRNSRHRRNGYERSRSFARRIEPNGIGSACRRWTKGGRSITRGDGQRGKNARARKGQGTIEAGKLADLVILEADPLADISNIRRINRVIKAGVVYDPADLLRATR
jgi:hypothetical protein